MRTRSQKTRKIIKNRLSISASFIAATAEAKRPDPPPKNLRRAERELRSRVRRLQHCFPQSFSCSTQKKPPTPEAASPSAKLCGCQVIDVVRSIYIERGLYWGNTSWEEGQPTCCPPAS